MKPIQRRENLDIGYEIFIAAISILSVFNLLLLYIPGIDPDAQNVLFLINLILTVMFVYDFSLRFATAPDRSFYFFRNYGWADLGACIPVLRILRLFRIYKAYRLIKKYGTKYIVRYISTHRPAIALYILLLSVIFILEFGPFFVLIAESGSPDANITTAGDALWWAYVTITTVGYGDQYPVTRGGRLVGVMVMTMGVVVFATFAGLISSKLLAPVPEEEKPPETPEADPAAAYLAQLKQYVREREKIDSGIREKIEELDRLLSPQAGKEEQGT
jgi:voltage-gated potassium channel